MPQGNRARAQGHKAIGQGHRATGQWGKGAYPNAGCSCESDCTDTDTRVQYTPVHPAPAHTPTHNLCNTPHSAQCNPHSAQCNPHSPRPSALGPRLSELGTAHCALHRQGRTPPPHPATVARLPGVHSTAWCTAQRGALHRTGRSA